MIRRLAAVALSACALCAVAPTAAPAAAGPPDVQWVIDCLTYGGPPNGPVEPAVGAALCLAGHFTG
jgi:hypothetical protein